MIKYSFIIPTYNNETLLKNTLLALNHLKPKSRNDYEVIVVDDGSTKELSDFMTSLNTTYNIKYIYIKRTDSSSRAKARNVGINQAVGEYVVFIDADIIVKENFLQELDRCYALNHEMIVAGTRILLQEPVEPKFCENGHIFDTEYLQSKGATPEFREEVFRDLSYNAANMNNPFLFCFTCNLAIPRTWINKVHGFDENLKKWGVEDVELVYRLYQLGLKVIFNYKNQVLHQFHGIKEGKFVKKEQESEVDYNSAIFINKHPGAMGLSSAELKALFRSIATRYKLLEKSLDETENCVYIHFKNPNSLIEVQEMIQQLIETRHMPVIIYDYVETTNLDIWIQLQNTYQSIVKYFPMSHL